MDYTNYEGLDSAIDMLHEIRERNNHVSVLVTINITYRDDDAAKAMEESIRKQDARDAAELKNQ